MGKYRYDCGLRTLLRMARILIVEDNQKLLKMNRDQLEKAGYDVETALNGEQAIAMMDKKKIDLLLLDLLMPKVNGFGVMIHAREKKYTFPILILTNLSQKIDRRECEKLGAIEFMVKSDNDIQDIVEKVRTILR